MKLDNDEERREIDRKARNLSWGLLALILLVSAIFVGLAVFVNRVSLWAPRLW